MSVSSWIHASIRVGSFGLAATALSVVLSTGCDNTAEGDPCDIALSHDECSNAPTVACIVPPNCTTGNAYCCSVDSNGNDVSTATNCLPCTAPGDDAGGTAPEGGEGGTD